MIAPLLTMLLLAAAPDHRPDLVGRVTSTSGGPVAGARVLINSAAVRRGTSPLCPSCYLDCAKGADTDGDGRFRIASVDPELLFNVLVVADGFRPAFAPKSDPTKAPVAVALAPFDPGRFAPDLLIRGVVLGPAGRPLPGAKVTPRMFRTEAYSGFSPDIFDPVAVTNLRGEFAMTSKSPIESVDLKVEGQGVAPRTIPGLRPGRNPHRLGMTPGATLTGRVVRDGRPLAGVAVGLVQANRSMQSFLGDATIGTDREGRFTFLNVHPDDDYFVYGLMEGFPDGGAVAARPVRVGGEGATTDAGDLAAVRGHRLRGRVLLSDEKPIPPKTRLMVSREDAWDHRSVELGPDGRFEITGLPTERYSLNVMLKGYRMSARNHSVDPQNPSRFVGTIDEDIDGLKILMEPGERR